MTVLARRVLRSLGILSICATMGIAAAASAQQPVVTQIPGKPVLALSSYSIEDLGYTVTEFAMSGTASSYHLTGAASPDGKWQAAPGPTASYTTRIVVLRPADAKKFNGTVIVEWLNVSGGLDVPVDWMTLHRELVREGYAYVAVSAQKVGIDGAASPGHGPAMALRKVDPERYGALVHPGDAFSFDVFSDAGRLLKRKAGVAVLGGLRPKRVLAVGESQSAFFLATYVNAIDPSSRVFDGFLIHSRSGIAAPLDGRQMIGAPPSALGGAIKLRPNLRVPVMQVITETDLMGLLGSVGFHEARQADTARLRTWEIAGTAHADNYLFRVGSIDTGSLPLDQLAAAWAPLDNIQGMKLAQPMNNAPQHHYVTEAALHHLDWWVRSGKRPPAAPPLTLGPGMATDLARDDLGLTLGGLRTPWVDVPVAITSGIGASAPTPLVGTTRPLDTASLDRLYPGGKVEYLHAFTEALDRTIAAGYILAADRAEIIGLADAGFHGSR